jgi:hypothetical protein
VIEKSEISCGFDFSLKKRINYLAALRNQGVVSLNLQGGRRK